MKSERAFDERIIVEDSALLDLFDRENAKPSVESPHVPPRIPVDWSVKDSSMRGSYVPALSYLFWQSSVWIYRRSRSSQAWMIFSMLLCVASVSWKRTSFNFWSLEVQVMDEKDAKELLHRSDLPRNLVNDRFMA